MYLFDNDVFMCYSIVPEIKFFSYCRNIISNGQLILNQILVSTDLCFVFSFLLFEGQTDESSF